MGLDMTSLGLSLRPGGGSPLGNLAKGAKGNVKGTGNSGSGVGGKNKNKNKGNKHGNKSTGGGEEGSLIGSHPITPNRLPKLDASSAKALFPEPKGGILRDVNYVPVMYAREELLKYKDLCTDLPSALEGTTFEVVLQPGEVLDSAGAGAEGATTTGENDAAGAGGNKTGEGSSSWKKTATNNNANEANWKKEKGGSGAGKTTTGGKATTTTTTAKTNSMIKQETKSKGGSSSKIVKASDVGLTAWAPKVAQSDTERVLRQVRGILNKLTPENFERLFTKLVECITTADILSGSISMLFEKAVAEPMFCSLNAELCLRLSKELPEFPPTDGDLKPMTFRRVLLNTCQEEFEGSLMGLTEEEGPESEDADSKAKRRMLGNVKLIGHLFTRKVINQKIVHVCIQQLLSGNITTKEGGASVHENCIECACELLSLTAKQLQETIQAVPLLEGYFTSLDDLSAEPELSSRVRFIIKDVQELRRAKWIPRKEAQEAKTISEIHAQAQAELGIAVLPDSLAKSFAPLSGMKTKADEVQDLLPALRGGDQGWDLAGKKNHDESNIIDGVKYSALIGDAPPVPTRQQEKTTEEGGDGQTKETTSTSTSKASTPEELEKRTKSLLTEYVSSADVGEALLCVKELNSVEFMPKVVELIISSLLDNAKPAEKDLLVNLLVSLKTRNAISESDLATGLHAHTDLLEDLAIDVPLAPQLIGEAVAACIVGGAATLGLMKELCEKMEGCEVTRKFVIAILLKLRQKGMGLKDLLNEFAMNLEEVLKADPEFDPPDLPSVKDFLASKGLSSLLS